MFGYPCVHSRSRAVNHLGSRRKGIPGVEARPTIYQRANIIEATPPEAKARDLPKNPASSAPVSAAPFGNMPEVKGESAGVE